MSSFMRTGRVLALTALAGAASASAQDIYVSATFNPDAEEGLELSTQLIGSRFTVSTTTDVCEIGGNLTLKSGSDPQVMYGAIVSLSNGVPLGSPLDAGEEGEVVASTLFTLTNFASQDLRIPLMATLEPGTYALIFGSDPFETDPMATIQEGLMPNTGQTDTAGVGSYMFWNPGSGASGQWFDEDAGFTGNGFRFVVVGCNEPPVADIAIQRLTDIGGTAVISLDASGSSDADHDNFDLTYVWTIDEIAVCDGSESTCAVIQILAAVGPHEITLTVTDPLGASNQASTTITIADAALSLLDVRRAAVNFQSAPQLTEIDIIGGIGLPPGVDFSEIFPQAAVRLQLSDEVVLPPTGVDLTPHGAGGSQWRFDGPEGVVGISRFYIDWRGARYRFSERGFPVRLTSDLITSQGTVLEVLLRPNQIDEAFTLDIDILATIDFAADGTVTSTSLPSVEITVVRPGRVTLELPFAITASSVITFSGGLNNMINVAADLTSSVGRFRLTVLADSNPFGEGSATTPRTIDFVTLIGDLGAMAGDGVYAGSVALDETDLSVSGTSWVTD